MNVVSGHVEDSTRGRPPLLSLSGLTVEMTLRRQAAIYPVDDVSLDVNEGEVLGLVGESGCGKSTLALAIMQLLPPVARVVSGQVILGGADLVQLGPHEMRRLRGSAVAMVFQEPMSSLDPVFTVGAQMVEAIRHHGPVTRTEAFAKAIGLLDALDISDPERWMSAYPHHLSGGMAQRVGLAIALAGEPKLLIADEPTTALDVTLQAQALKRIAGLKSEFHLSVLFITHDLAVINEIADRVAVMYCGRIVEIGPTDQILGTPAHPYTHGLLRSLPGFVTGKERIPTIAGSVADLLTLPAGCKFEPRCPNRIEVCSGREPDFEWRTRDHGFRCYNPTAH